MLSVVAVPAGDGGRSGVLAARVRVEFAGPVVRVDPGDPVFGRGPCGVAGCERTSWARRLCSAHHQRWTKHGKPDVDHYRSTTGPIAERAGSERVDTFDLSSLATRPRLEVSYVLQCRHDDRSVRVPPSAIRDLIGLLSRTGGSLLDRPLHAWLGGVAALGRKDPTRTRALVAYAYRHLADVDGIDIETEYAGDIWVAARLGIRVARAPNQTRFDAIGQPWLRRAVKRWARLRLGSGKTFGTVHIDVKALVWFSRYLAARDDAGGSEATITRDVLEGYLVWLTATHLSAHTTSTYITCLRSFLDACRRHHWLPGLAPTAALYNDDLARRPRPLPRFIAEFVMNQLEDPAKLDVLPDATTRALVVLITETGLRANDACALAFNPVTDDSAGWPCLRYFNTKMSAEQLVPLSPKAAETIQEQQADLRRRWPSHGPVVLFPAPHSNPDGTRPFNYATLRSRLAKWQDDIDLRDEAGRPTRVTAHRFRHTLGTRLINQGVPQHVIQRLLGHASPQMTARYASLHDTTVRHAFDEFCKQRVNLAGERITYDPAGPTADAEFTKHNLSRVQASLPNGYCGRPPQQDCPHPNACLTCPDFQTTPAFLDIHRRQRDDTRILIATAEHDGRFRLAANHRHVHDNLDQLIDALETIGDPTT